MNHVFVRALCFSGVALLAANLSTAAVDIQVVGPAGPEVKYVESDLGGHLASVARKGSRMVVTVDGVAGPKFDDVLLPSFAWVDPRAAQTNSLVNINLRHGADQPQAQPVIFSHDGSRYAYLARSNTDWVLMVDNKEMLRLPPVSADGTQTNVGSSNIRLQFSGNSGKHLLFAKSTNGGYELWVDGQKWPGLFSSGGLEDECVDPLISPDGERIAYAAQIARDKQTLIVDGRDAGFLGSNLHFSPDSKHLVCQVTTPKGTAVVVDGHPLGNAKQLFGFYLAPAGTRIALIIGHEYPDHSKGQVMVIDGKPVEATLCHEGIKRFTFSPDGQHYAAVCCETPTLYYVVADGKKGQQYAAMGATFAGTPGGGIQYSPDSSKLVYLAQNAGKMFVVINEDESDAFDNLPNFRFSPDGKHVAYSGNQNSPQGAGVVIDDKAEHFERIVALDNFDFSPDSAHHAYFGSAFYVDGKTLPLSVTDFAFNPDGTHLAAVGYRPSDNKRGVWVDGQLVYTNDQPVSFLTFSADGQHLYWVCREPTTGPNAGQGTWDFVTYLDGKEMARADAPTGMGGLVAPLGYGLYTKHPGWQTMGPAGLVWIGTYGGEAKRFTITPDGTTVDSMLADAKAAAAAAAEAALKGKRKK